MKAAVDNVVPVPEWAVPVARGISPAASAARLSIGFVALYLILDRLSFIGALHGIGITPWSPSSGANATDGTINKLTFVRVSRVPQGYQMSDSHH